MSAGVLWDRCGAPLLQIGGGTLMHVLPVTVYHVERYVWAGKAAGLDWERVLPSERPRPPFGDDEDLDGLWARHLTVGQADDIARWLGGRLPMRSEWQRAVNLWNDRWSLSSRLRPCPRSDERLRQLVSVLVRRRVARRSALLPPSFGEFAVEFSHGSHGRVSVMSTSGADGVVTPSSHATFLDDSVGFCCVFDEASGDLIKP